jgi:SAM-dependent methyltransferase
MINYLFSLFQDPKKGFDPVPAKYADMYFEQAYNGQRFNKSIIDQLEKYISIKNKKVLDLGAGPGQYTHYFANQGADTYYHDISARYLSKFRQKFPNLNFTATLDYLDNFKGQYDLIFNNVCFNYGMNDRKLVKKISEGLNPNGIYFGILGNENALKKELKSKFRILIQFYLNDFFGIKIGHPFTSKRRIKKLFSANKFEILAMEDFENNTLVILKNNRK